MQKVTTRDGAIKATLTEAGIREVERQGWRVVAKAKRGAKYWLCQLVKEER